MDLQITTDRTEIFAPLLQKWIPFTPEEKVKQEFILRLVNDYGYSLNQMMQDYEIKNGIFADIAIWKVASSDKKSKPSIIIAIDCKAEYITIKKEDISEKYRLATIVQSDFFIASNLKETKIFRIIKNEDLNVYESLKDLPKANQITSNEAINKYIDETKAFTRDDFTKLLNKCHNIIRNNDKLSPEAAFDEISKILFMKIMYERNPDKELVFTYDTFLNKEKNYKDVIEPSLKEQNPNFNKDYIQYEFDLTKRRFKDHKLFEDSDIIKIRRNSFELIVRELEIYNLSATSDDIKGIAFEEFLGRTFRGELGQFFTPRTIVDYMVKILDPEENEIVCDPCCGSGGFLIKTFEYVRDKIEQSINHEQIKIEKKYGAKSKIKATLIKNLHRDLDIERSGSRIKKLSSESIYGTDANPRMARTAKMNMIMHGDGHGGVHHNDGLLNVNGIFENRFDVILTNPPFGARVDKNQLITNLDLPDEENKKLYSEKYKEYNYEDKVIKQLEDWANFENKRLKVKGTPIIDVFEVGKYSSLTEVLFIERCLNLLKPGGRMGIVLPEGVLNNPNLQKVRDYVETKAKILLITSIPQDVFVASGATVKPSLLFLKKFTEDEAAKFNEIYDECLQELILDTDVDLDLVTDKKELNINKRLKNIPISLQRRILVLVKERFNYDIPYAEVSKAGISSTGAVIENELIPLEVEYSKYRKKEELWKTQKSVINYALKDNKLVKIITDNETLESVEFNYED